MLQKMSVLALVTLVYVSVSLTVGFDRPQTASMQAAITAIKNGDLSKLKELLKASPNLTTDKDSRYGATLLHWAASNMNLEIIKLLKARGARLEAQNKELATPLHVAILKAKEYPDDDALEIIEHLFDKRIANIPNVDGKTALHLACEYEQVEIVEFLLRNGVEVNSYTKSNQTPLDYADARKNEEIIELLIKHGGERYKQTAYRNSALYRAVMGGNLIRVKEELRKNPGLLNERGPGGETLLHTASKYCRLDIVIYLIRQRDIAVIKDDNGRNFLEVACRP